MFEIPKNPVGNAGSQNGNTPHVYKRSGSSNVAYGVFSNDVTTNTSGYDYSVIAVRLTKTTENGNNAGTMSCFVNDNKYTDISYSGRGNIIYLSHCTYAGEGFGNNTFKMIAVFDVAQTDEEISSNIASLYAQYID